MVLLYYKNLEEGLHRPDVLMKMTVNGLTDFYKYLKHFKIYLESVDAVFRVAWEKSDFQRKNGNKGFWVSLTEPEDRPDLSDAVFQAFMDDEVKTVFQAEAFDLVAMNAEHRWDFDKSNEISVLDRDPENYCLLLERKPDKNKQWLLLRPNTYQIKKQLEAIQNLQNKPLPEHRPLLRLFETNKHAQWGFVDVQDIQQWKLLTDCKRPGTESQRNFVKIALATPDFAFLEGPPGSGKTTAICELILQLIAEDKRVLLCASTHVAVDNVLERLMAEDNQYREQIIPVRIGDKSNVSDAVKQYQFEELKRTEKRRLIKFLNDQNPRSRAQQCLLDALQSKDDENSAIVRLILDSVNLVCGTTIGILQHPDIKEKRQPEPVFDMLIVDEASKTLFPEFLVPALWAKRWVLVGDPRQLSPYVDDEAIAKNVEASLQNPIYRDACLDVFQIMKNPKNGSILVASKEKKVAETYRLQAEAYQNKILFANAQTDKMTLACASIVVDSPDNLVKHEHSLPLDIYYLRGDTEMLHTVQRRLTAWRENRDLTNQEKKSWGGEIAWRLARQFENRLSKNELNSMRLDNEVKELLPVDVTLKQQVQEDIERIRRVALPSVLEALLNGFGRREKQKNGTALTGGLPIYVKEQRHVLLEYQHRMHPDISAYSRVNIYNGKALKDPLDMAKRRDWIYTRYNQRAVWLDVKDERRDKGNSNQREADEIISEIKEFHAWAKTNPRIDGKAWSVAVLSFYRAQEKLLREKLRDLSNQRQAYTHFYLGGDKYKHEVQVDVCTVDRFQGHEADLVFLSFVKNHPTVFLGSPNRLNVAVTRARYQLVLVGNVKSLANSRYPELSKLVKSIPHNKTWKV
ncbi:MAG: AAA family ATPase [Treponema sp.]|nr:AAA family ATPase [Treponema sp.]